MVINMELALIFHPEGVNLFILQNVGKATTAEVSWGVVPVLAILGLLLLWISWVPRLTTWLPALLIK
jgi:C4-dicarboxylate transporter DctM subunit